MGRKGLRQAQQLGVPLLELVVQRNGTCEQKLMSSTAVSVSYSRIASVSVDDIASEYAG